MNDNLDDLYDQRERIKQAHPFASTAKVDHEIFAAKNAFRSQEELLDAASHFAFHNNWPVWESLALIELCYFVTGGGSIHWHRAYALIQRSATLCSQLQSKPINLVSMSSLLIYHGLAMGKEEAVFMALQMWTQTRSELSQSTFIEALCQLDSSISTS
jgi:hypothetical protein